MSLFPINTVPVPPFSFPQVSRTENKSSDHLSKHSCHSNRTNLQNLDRKRSAASFGSGTTKEARVLRVVNENVLYRSSHRSASSPIKVYDGDDKSFVTAHSGDSSAKVDLPSEHSVLRVVKVRSGKPGNVDCPHDLDVNERRTVSQRSADPNKDEKTPSSDHVALGCGDIDSSPSERSTDSCTDSGRHAIADKPESKKNRFKSMVEAFRPQVHNVNQLIARKDRWSLDDFDGDQAAGRQNSDFLKSSTHRKSSWSTASFTAPSGERSSHVTGSTGPRFLKPPKKSKFLFRSNRGSKASDTSARGSCDSSAAPVNGLDEAARERAIQRRKVIEELYSSEEAYVNDLKILAHVYLTILATAPEFPALLQWEIEQNLNDMLILHEEVLIHMKLFLTRPTVSNRGHFRGRSQDSRVLNVSVPNYESRKSRRSFDSLWSRSSKNVLVYSAPNEAADMAKIFGAMIPRFSIYEDYGARYESILHLVATTSRTIPSWGAFERGIEALMNSFLPKTHASECKKKALTLEDLLIKPVQRVCRYPLLLAELLKQTPAVDSEESEAIIKSVLTAFRGVAKQINGAASDTELRMKVEQSWQLRALLDFPKPTESSVNLRSLGHVKLCGLLYVVFEHRDMHEPYGQFMLGVLFGTHFLLAEIDVVSKRLNVKCLLPKEWLIIRDANGQRGLRCRENDHAWKVTFGIQQMDYEMLICACTPSEQTEWTTGLSNSCTNEENVTRSAAMFVLDLELQPISSTGNKTKEPSERGASQDFNGGLATTVAIRNVYSSRGIQDSPRSISSSLKRSHTVRLADDTHLLGPERSERGKLEAFMDSVWSKNAVTFSGWANQRSSNFIRASRDSVIRKLSRASTNTQSSQQTSNQPKSDEYLCGHKADVTSLGTIAMQGGPVGSQASNLDQVLMERGSPPERTARSIAFQRNRRRAKSDATLVAGRHDRLTTEASDKPKKGNGILKALKLG